MSATDEAGLPDGPPFHAVAPKRDGRRVVAEWDGLETMIREAPTKAGLDILRAIEAGELPAPPVHHLLGIVGARFHEGFAALTMATHESHYNPMSVVHGGVLATLLDSAMGCAVHSTLPAGSAYTTLDLHVQFVRPAVVGSGVLRVEGRIVHRGTRTATTDGKIVDANDRLLAHATSTCLIITRA